MENDPNRSITVQPTASEIDFVNVNIQNQVLDKFGDNNKYKIKNQYGEVILYGLEDRRDNTHFKLYITNDMAEEILTLQFVNRNFKLCYLPCKFKETNILSASNDNVAIIKKSWDYKKCSALFIIKNSDGNIIFNIKKNNLWPATDIDKLKYEIIKTEAANDSIVGYIISEGTKDSPTTKLKVNFPKNLDSNSKVLLIAASFVINYAYFKIVPEMNISTCHCSLSSCFFNSCTCFHFAAFLCSICELFGICL